MYLIDSLALIYRAHFAFADHKRLKTTSGIDTTAAYGYLRYLLAVLREEPVATHIVACFDGPAGPHASRSVLSWRNTLFPDYKAGRSPTPLEVIDAIPTLQVRGWSSLLSHVDRDELSVAFSPLFFFLLFSLQETLSRLGISFVDVPGVEADDCVATMTKRAIDAGMDVTIVSADKDFHQLLGPRVRMFKPVNAATRRKKTEGTVSRGIHLKRPHVKHSTWT